MRRIKKISVARYITEYMLLIVLVLSLVMVIVANILTNRVIYYDTQSTLVQKLVNNNRSVSYEDDVVKPDETFKYIDEGIYYQIVSDDGTILLGETPEDLALTRRNLNQRLDLIEKDGDEYYIVSRVNRDLTLQMGRIIYSRAIVLKDDIDSKYEIIKYVFYVSVPTFLLFALAASFAISRRISQPLKHMSKTAEAIGTSRELSERMEYDGRISELDVLTQTNNQMLETVEDMYETQKRFSSDVAHELRTPIAVLLAQCEYAKEYTSNKEEFDEAIDVIYRQTQKTNQVITQLLNLNRLENHRVTLEMEEADIDDIICSICDDIEFKEKDAVHFDLHLSGVIAKMDIGFMMILLQNLIQNAVKYSDRPAKVEITTQYQGADVCVKVQDFGCGMSKEDMQHIFVPFYRVEKSRNSEGFGLGLSLADRIARVHGGRIEVESKLGEGSTFILLFPKE